MALEKARQSAANGGDIEIYLNGGFYEMQEPLRLTPEHSGADNSYIRIMAVPGETPILSGGVRVPKDSWTLHDPSKNIYRSHVRPLLQTRLPDLLVMQLYVNGRRAQCARGPDVILTRTDEGYSGTPDGMASWGNTSHIRVRERIRWMSRVCGVESIQGTNITLQDPCWAACRFFEITEDPANDPRKWFENAYELLDKPGEWYLNRTDGYLYYIPRIDETMSDGQAPEVVIPVLEKLLVIEGEWDAPVRNVHFKGLVFAHGTWRGPGTNIGYADLQGGLYLKEASFETGGAEMPSNLDVLMGRNIIFERNIFTHLGAGGLELMSGSQGTAIEGNIFEDISGSAIKVGALGDWSYEGMPGGVEAWVISDTRIENSLIRKPANEYDGTPGINVRYARRTRIAHNLLNQLRGMGITIGAGHGEIDAAHSHDNHIENNEFSEIMLTMRDGGMVYVDDANPNSTVSGNYFHGNGNNVENTVLYLEDGSQFWRYFHNVVADLQPGTNDIFIDYVQTPARNNIAEDYYVQHHGVGCYDVADPPCLERNIIRNVHEVPDKCWPQPAIDIIRNAGLEPEFQDLLTIDIPEIEANSETR